MPVRTDLPQIAVLKIAVENRFGRTVKNRTDFACLVFAIEKETMEHIAENTLRRIWGLMKGYDTVFERTLDVLSKYAGYGGWSDFLTSIRKESGKESDIVSCGRLVKTENLQIGDRLRIGWLPDRLCVVELEGGRTFRAVKTENSTMRPGDTFECSLFILGYPLTVDNFVHDGKTVSRYVMGTDHGLTTLEQLKSSYL